jgi:hypothetical protein
MNSAISDESLAGVHTSALFGIAALPKSSGKPDLIVMRCRTFIVDHEVGSPSR